MDSRALDVREFPIVSPFNPSLNNTDETPRYVDGADCYITSSGTLRGRPVGVAIGAAAPGTISRCVLYRNLSNTIYIVASILVSGVYKVYQTKLSDASPTWVSLGSYRSLDASTLPHIFVQNRGLLFIKSFPSGGDKYGSVVWDGVTVKPWGLPPPTQPARITSPGSWAASTNSVSVLFGWTYTYCWVSNTGQYSCRAPLETSPTQNPSTTGAFTNKKPSITVRGNADTTNIPYIAIFRTTDGGGSFYFLEQIPNTGDVDIVYTDNHREQSTTNNPKTDSQLDTLNVAPSLVSNLPPPPVGYGKTPGVDDPDPSTPAAAFARRLWYAIGNRIYFSGQEEITNGVPEECWPNNAALSGRRGNYFVVEGVPYKFAASQNALYILTSSEVLRVTGTDRTNLNVKSALRYGASPNPLAFASWGDNLWFETAENQIAWIGPSGWDIISVPVASYLSAQNNTQMTVMALDGLMWLLVVSGSKILIYDIVNKQWFPPWSIQANAILFGQISPSDPKPSLLYAAGNQLYKFDFSQNSSAFVTLGPVYIPAGNHINLLRKPAHTPEVSYLATVANSPVTAMFRTDEQSGAFAACSSSPASYITSSSFSIQEHHVMKMCQFVQFKVSFTGELLRLAVAFLAEP